LLKHLPFWRQLFFLLYTLLVGDVPGYGIVRIILCIALTGNWEYRQLLLVAFSGKSAGIRTYLNYRCSRRGFKDKAV
jgi:hypothetical protein